MIDVRVGARALLDVEPSWDAAAERLRAFPLESVLDVVGRIGAVVRTAEGATTAAHLRLCRGLFRPSRADWIERHVAALVRDARRRDPHMPAAAPALFDPVGLSAALRIACAVCDASRRPAAAKDRAEDRDWGPAKFEGIAEAVLIANDLLEDDRLNPTEHDLDTLGGRGHWLQYVLVGSPARNDGPLVHRLVRAADLYLSPHPDLRGPGYVDLPELFARATGGLGVSAYLRAALVLLASPLATTAENVANHGAGVLLGPLREAGRPLGLGEDLDRVLPFVCCDAGAFRRAVADEYPAGELHAYDLRPFARWPLVRFGGGPLSVPTAAPPVTLSPAPGASAGPDIAGRDPAGPARADPADAEQTEQGPEVAVCHSVRLLEERLTTGLHEILLDATPADGPERMAYQKFTTRVFEDYVDRLLRRMYGAYHAAAGQDAPGGGGASRAPTRQPAARRAQAPAPRHIPGPVLTAYLERRFGKSVPEHGDGLLVWGNNAVLFEAKGGLLPPTARAGERPDLLSKRLERIVVEGAGQLDGTARLLADGTLQDLGADPGPIRHVFPVLVTRESLPLDLIFRWWLDERLAQEGVLSTPRVGRARLYPLEILHVSDLEWVETAHADGLTLPGVLRRKHAERWGRNHSLATYAAVRGLGGTGPGHHNPYLERRFDELTGAPHRELRDMAAAALAARAAGGRPPVGQAPGV